MKSLWDFSKTSDGFQPPDKTPHRIITAAKPVLGSQILINALDGQTGGQRRLNPLLPRLTQTVRPGAAQSQNAGLRVGGGFWL